jgi:hypothetical protein
MQDAPRLIDIEFTLALNNRTGKYFFCRDLIDAAPENFAAISNHVSRFFALLGIFLPV